MLALTVADDTQEFDQRTLQIHQAPNTKSDLLYKNALRDRAKTIFSGLIVVDPDAQKTDAYQSNRNLMLSEDAEASSLPGLEIQANDVPLHSRRDQQPYRSGTGILSSIPRHQQSRRGRIAHVRLFRRSSQPPRKRPASRSPALAHSSPV
jgi:hypothetical protein